MALTADDLSSAETLLGYLRDMRSDESLVLADEALFELPSGKFIQVTLDTHGKNYEVQEMAS